jgi:multidrug efflux pump subunit AcrA (membrane-fusion protein)
MKKIKLPIIIIAAVILAACFFLLIKDDAVSVSSIKAYKGSVTKTIEVSGSVNSQDVEIIPIEPNIEVKKVYVKENDMVEVDQLLAELDSGDLVISLEKAKLNLAELESDLNDVSGKSDLILLENTVSKNKEEYENLSQDLVSAKEDLKKAELLFNENAISKSEYEKYVSKVYDANTSLKKAELNLADARINFSDYETQKELNKDSLKRQIQSLKLDIENLNKKIEETKIYSSVSGIVTEFPLQESRRTLSGQQITIHSTEVFEFTAQAAQKDAALVEEGQKSKVFVDGINYSYEGTVTYVSKQADIDKESKSMLPKVELKIQITNPDDKLVFGYEGQAKIIIDSQEDALVVKNESIKKEEDKEFVYVLDGNSAKKTYVETGLTDGYVTNIENGLEENEVVIVNPPYDLQDGMAVKSSK